MSPDRPLMIFNGACSFCRRWIARWERWTGERVAYAPSQVVAAQYPNIPAQRFKESVVMVMPDGRVYFGAEAVARSLAVRAPAGVLLWVYLRVPFMRALGDWAYGVVAEGRGRWPFR